MNGGLISALTVLAAIGSGLVGGVFFAFSTFIMRALARLRPPQGIAAMQSINVAAVAPPFMAALFGTAAACAALVVSALAGPREPAAVLRLVGSGLYLIGAVLVTIVCNVPRNNALAAVDPDGAAGEQEWALYVPVWTRWNSVRTCAALAAMLSFIAALLADRARP